MKRKKHNLFVILALVLFLTGFVLFIYWITDNTMSNLKTINEVEVVDCFDRYGNKIIGETCLHDKFKTIELDGQDFVIIIIIALLWEASFLIYRKL